MTRLVTISLNTARQFGRLLRDDRGSTAIEYGLIAGGVAVVIAATIFSLGSSVKTNLYQRVLDAFN